MGEIQDAAISFVNQLRADDRVMVVSFSDKIKILTQPTNDRNTLRDAIRRDPENKELKKALEKALAAGTATK